MCIPTKMRSNFGGNPLWGSAEGRGECAAILAGIAQAMGAKKGRLGLLPDNWQEALLAAAQQSEISHGATYAPVLALLWATGCRPDEIAKGIDVGKDGKEWKFIIPGAKLGITGGVAGKAKRGQEFRTIKVQDTGALWCKVLSSALGVRSFMTIKSSSADTIGTQIKRLAKREFGDLPASRLPSAYSFRHSLARDLKTQGVEVETIATILGHASCRSSSRYGRWRQGGGSKAPLVIDAVASNRPRGAKEKKNTSGLGRFKAASAIKSAMKAKTNRP